MALARWPASPITALITLSMAMHMTSLVRIITIQATTTMSALRY